MDDADVTSSGATTISATSNANINALTIAGAGAVALGSASGLGLSLAGAGTGSGNIIDSVISARVDELSSINSGGSVTVETDDAADITANAVSGSLSLAVGQGGAVAIGIAIADNQITIDALALADDAAVTAAGDVDFEATGGASIKALSVGAAVSLSAGSTGFNLAGSGAAAQSTNTIKDGNEAIIQDGAIVKTTGSGSVSVFDDNTSAIEADSGGGSLAVSGNGGGAAGAFAVSAALSTNNIADDDQSFVIGAGTTVTSAGAVTVQSTDDTSVFATSVSIAVSVAATNPLAGFALALAGAGAQANNTIANVDNAFVTAGASVTAKGAIAISAFDSASIAATVPAVALTISLDVSASIGVSLSDNIIKDTVDAYITDATVKSTSAGVTVAAESDGSISAQATPVAVSISIGVSGAGGDATTTIGGITDASIGDGATVSAPGYVDVTAGSTASVNAETNGGGAGVVSVGEMVADAEITQTIRASLDGDANITAGNLNVLTHALTDGSPATSSRTATATVIVGNASVVGVDGGSATSNISGTVTAEIDSTVIANVTGKTAVDAVSTSTVNAQATGGSAGGITVSALQANATISGGTSALINGTTQIHSGSLDVTANAVKSTTANAVVTNVSVIGVVGGKATATDSADTIAEISNELQIVNLKVIPAVLDVTGEVTVSATSSETTTSSASGGDFGIITADGLKSDSESSGSTLAYLNNGTDLSAGSLGISADQSQRNVSSDEDSGAAKLAVSGVGVLNVTSTANVTGNVEGFIGGDATVTTPATGSVSIDAANAKTSAIADAQGGSGGIAEVNLFQASARIGTSAANAQTYAGIIGGETLTTGTLTIASTETSTVSTQLLSVAVGAAVGVATASSQANSFTSSNAEVGEDTITVAKDVSITATSSDAVNAQDTAGGGGIGVGVGAASGTSQAVNITTAVIDQFGKLSAGGNITVSADNLGESADSNLLAGSGGLISVGTTHATASSTPTVAANIGQDAVLTATGNINVLAAGSGASVANSESDGGGGVQVGLANATSNYTPSVNATVSLSTTLKAGGNVTVNSNLASHAAAPPSEVITSVNPATNTAAFAYPLQTGQAVEYAPTGTPIGGLTAGQNYNVIVVSNGQIQFGDDFDAGTLTETQFGPIFTSDVNPLTDIIGFRQPSNLQIGQPVQIESNGGTSILSPGVTGKTFYVEGVYNNPNDPNSLNPLEIRLAPTQAIALASEASLLKSETAIANNRITIPGNTFVNGQAVTYRASDTQIFTTEDVDATEVTVTYTDANGNTQTGPDIKRDANGVGLHTPNNIIVIPNHGFSTGDAVTYTFTGVNDGDDTIGGLPFDEGTYYVIKINNDEIELALTHASALAHTAITISPQGNQSGTQSLSRNLTNLVDQQTYYVINKANDGSFQLASTPGGTPISVDNGEIINGVHVVDRGGAALFGTLGIDLQQGSGTQSLVIPLTSMGTRAQRLEAPGGLSLDQAAPLPNGGVSSAVADGGSGGFIDVDAVQATLTVTATVDTEIGSGATVTAGGNVDIEAVTQTASSSDSDTNGGGFVAVGTADAITNGAASTSAKIESGSTVNAGGNLTLNAAANHTISANANSDGGGLVSAKLAEESTSMSGETLAEVGGDAVAGHLLSVTSNVQDTANGSAYAYSIALGAGADADTKISNAGVNLSTPATISVDPGATLTGDAVSLKATTGPINATDSASATAIDPILLGVASAFANATVNVDSPATVLIKGLIGGATQIAGNHGVDIIATVAPLVINRNSKVLAVAIIPPQKAQNLGSDSLTVGDVETTSNVQVTAGIRNQATTPLTKNAAIPQLALVVNGQNDTDWQSNVTLLSNDPTLVVDANGNVTSEQGLTTFTAAPDTVVVNNINGPSAGQVWFTGAGTVEGTQGTFTFNEYFGNVNITINKGQLVLNNITTYQTNASDIEPKVTINVPSNALQFNVVADFGPTQINVVDHDPTNGNIILQGLIDNPIGTTTLTASGTISSANFASRNGVIQTNRLIMLAGGNIGGPGVMTGFQDDRIPINIVEAAGFPRFISMFAGENIYIGLQALNRNPAVTSNFTSTTSLAGSLFQAGGLADIMLLGGVNQTTSTATTPFGIQVLETALVKVPATVPSPPATSKTTPRTTFVYHHFRVDTGGPPTSAQSVAIFGQGGNLIPTTFTLGSIEVGQSINVYKAPTVTSTVNIFSNVRILPTSAAININANTNGFINLTDPAGDFRVGLIQSTTTTVTLDAVDGSIVDVPNNLSPTGDAAAHVVGTIITLAALAGGIGTIGDSLDVDSSNPTAGLVNASAQNSIYLDETAGNLNVGLIKSSTGDVNLEVTSGALLDADAGTAAHIVGNFLTFKIDKDATNGNAVGAVGNDVYIDSSFSGTGGLTVLADGRVGITQTPGTLNVVNVNRVDALTFPTVFLTTRDAATNNENIVVEGPVSVASITFTAGDNFAEQATAPITATGTVTISVDAPAADADPTFGANASVLGTVNAAHLAFSGGNQIDHFTLVPEKLTGGNQITVNGLPPNYPTFPGDVLTVIASGTVATNTVTSVPLGSGFYTFTNGYSTIAYVNIEQEQDVTAPQVTAVYANSTAWSPTFRDYVDGGFTNPAAIGYPIPQGSLQEQTLPWVNINQLKVTFSQDVGASLSLSDFSISAALGWTALGVPVGKLPNLIGISYDASTFTATLLFDNFFPASVIDLKIASAGVTNSQNIPLDGEWTNDVTTGHSGNGAAGGDFSFRIFILPGDTVDQSTSPNDTRTVNTNDAQEVRNTQNGIINPAFGALGYDPRADLDGSGTINSNDSQYSRDQQSAIIFPAIFVPPPAPAVANPAAAASNQIAVSPSPGSVAASTAGSGASNAAPAATSSKTSNQHLTAAAALSAADATTNKKLTSAELLNGSAATPELLDNIVKNSN